MPATTGYRVAGPVQEIRALRDQVEGGLGASGRGLVDVRSPEEYRGELLAAPHLPQDYREISAVLSSIFAAHARP